MSTLSRLIVLAVIFVIMSAFAATAQTDDETPIIRPLYFMQDDQIKQLNLETPRSSDTALWDVEVIETNIQTFGNILQIALDSNQRFAFRLEVTASDDRQRILYTRLVRTDLKSHEEAVLLERPGIIQFAVSPAADKVFILYYEGAAEQSRLIPCLLMIDAGECEEISVMPWTTSYPVWLDNQTLAMLTGARKVTLIDASSLQSTVLSTPDNFSIVSFAPIPNTHQFILGVNRYNAFPGTPIEFYTLDRDTQQVSEFAYDTIFDPRTIDGTTVTAWLFSPDGRYLLYGNMGLYTKMALVEYQTGRVIAQLDEITQATWLDNERLIFLQGSMKPVPVLEINSTTGAQSTLLSDANGIVILN